MSTHTSTIELNPIKPPKQAVLQPSKASSPASPSSGHSLQDATPPDDSTPHSLEQASPPPEAVEALPRWNKPKRNTYRLATIFYAFVNFGMNDAAYGPLLPYIQANYKLNYTLASLIFLSPFVGYILAALVSDRLHMFAGRRGMALISPLCRALAYIVICTHPPSYGAIVFMYVFVGIGNGLLDGAWNAWVGEMAQATQIMGLLHGCYGAGAVISPTIATAMVSKYGLGWWQFYYLMVGVTLVEAGVCAWAFWDDGASAYKARTRGSAENEVKGMTRKAMKRRTTWVCATFLFAYMGVEVSTGGYIVVFMTEVRHGKPYPSGLTATGFWLGLTMGRIVLGFVTPKIGERLSVIIYLIAAMGVELLFWLVPQFIVSAVAIALVGFFIGPFFPAAVLMAARLLPKELHVASIGFASALGGGGAAVLPFVVGVIVEAKGVKTLQPVILAFLVLMFVIWLCFPKLPKHSHLS